MIFCFDLDGTLCESVGNDYANTPPIQSRIDKVNTLFGQGHMIVICTARHKVWEGFTKLQLEKWKVSYHALQVGFKPVADIYIDDKGVRDTDFFWD